MKNNLALGLYIGSIAISFSIIYYLMYIYREQIVIADKDILISSIILSLIGGLFLYNILKEIQWKSK